jgi:hypothetical protein
MSLPYASSSNNPLREAFGEFRESIAEMRSVFLVRFSKSRSIGIDHVVYRLQDRAPQIQVVFSRVNPLLGQEIKCGLLLIKTLFNIVSDDRPPILDQQLGCFVRKKSFCLILKDEL